MTIDLVKAKSHLKIDYDDEDSDIAFLIEVSEIYIQSCVGKAYLKDAKGLKLAELLQLKLINDMHDIRGTDIPESSKKDRITTTILDVLSNIEEVF